MRPRLRRWGAAAAGLAVLSALTQPEVLAAERGAAPSAAGPGAAPGAPAAAAVPPDDRRTVLGRDWQESDDRAWTTSGDAQGFHVLVADQRDGYHWRTAATLTEPGFDADSWIGNACVTGSGERAVVVYAPRTFTNEAHLSERGGFTAVVELSTGAVTKLPVRTSLAYFNPGCGADETAVLTQEGDERLGATRLLRLDARTGRTAEPVETPGQVTSAVPVGKGIVAADGARLVSLAADGARTAVAHTGGTPFRLAPDRDGGVVFLDRDSSGATARSADGDGGKGGSTAAGSRTEDTTRHLARVRRVSAGQIKQADADAARPALLAQGPWSAVGLTRSADGAVFITGESDARTTRLPRTVRHLPALPKHSLASTRGEAVLTGTAWADGKDSRVRPSPAARPAALSLKVLQTGRTAAFTVGPQERTAGHEAQGGARSPALTGPPEKKAGDGPRPQLGTTSAPDWVEGEDERYCAVPRNDPANQVTQPKPRQVEWAVDQAILGNLDDHIRRPANWKNLGMGAYSPQDLFPRRGLNGGGHVPAQVMLGVIAQESNMWQAARFAVPGVTANPLIGNFYGIDLYDADEGNDWDIRWSDADCGYGLTQITDGMRLAGKTKPGETALSPLQQRAAALDYTANIAGGLRILEDKWNQTRAAGLTVNNDDPDKPENWFFALWAYNSGFYPESQKGSNGGAWGVGWHNNPANPRYEVNRAPFLETSYADAARPQFWPYPEKVLGWAAYPIEALESPGKLVSGFRPAWWTTSAARTAVKPPETLFCSPSVNDCDPAHLRDGASNDDATTGPCRREDFRCWWNEPVTWKENCATTCGNQIVRFDHTYPEEPDGTAYPPSCTRSGLPSGALIIDNQPTSVPSSRPGCAKNFDNRGTFDLDFAQDRDGSVPTGRYPSKVNTHQLGAGFGGHLYFSDTRGAGDAADRAKAERLKVTATWRLDRKLEQPARVWVHLMDHGVRTKRAEYEVRTANGTKTRRLNQNSSSNRWVPLGAFMFDNVPEVRLDNIATDGEGTDNVIFDAVAVEPIRGTYVEETVDAVAFFDERQNIDADVQSTWFVYSPLKSRKNVYEWAVESAESILDSPVCAEGPTPSCVTANVRDAVQDWYTHVSAVDETAVEPEDYPAGKGAPSWLSLANHHSYRPASTRMPDHFRDARADDATKMRSTVTVSFVKTDDGQIVEGSQWAEYSDRTADTHLPDFVTDLIEAVEEDYGVGADLRYRYANLNEYDGRVKQVDPLASGVLPGKAYQSIGVAPRVTGSCVAAQYTAGGAIGYRTLLDTDAAEAARLWKNQLQGAPVHTGVARLAGDVFSAFFNPGLLPWPDMDGSPYGMAPPIWQELSFKVCADGTIQRNGSVPILRASHMPDQYLYRNGQALNLDGSRRTSAAPVYSGNFSTFSRMGALTPQDRTPSAYGYCNDYLAQGADASGRSGNPWTIAPGSRAGTDPEGRFCSDRALQPDPDHSR
ncbi:hypothetical protein V1J52_13560 [Streptomyces sp. TRM 70351]|uniref:golvesin C-terminal-like domain-containing protein n=1 Tax=Streptomyces sp. TRM 70351 TaxID=3116552 RepID=UPI002E7B1C56|nr:hypothetical protein [Streptomyces sp. TRM 70351]MEE1929192.1 hypothetical protein [Streptomyces sp. TRM 70351]